MIKKILLSLSLGLSMTLTMAQFTIQAQDFNSGQWIDLTHAFDENAIYWPTADPFKKTTVFEGETDGGYFYSAYNFSATEHGGTRLDSPVHFSKGQMTPSAHRTTHWQSGGDRHQQTNATSKRLA